MKVAGTPRKMGTKLLSGRVVLDAFSQNLAGSWVDVVDLVAHGAGHRFVGMAVFRNIFGGKALDAGSGFRATVDKKRH